jgi:hypothetical protein
MSRTFTGDVLNRGEIQTQRTGAPVLSNPASRYAPRDLALVYMNEIKAGLISGGTAAPYLTGFPVPADGGLTPISATNPIIGITTDWLFAEYRFNQYFPDIYMQKFTGTSIEQNQKWLVKLLGVTEAPTSGASVYIDATSGNFTSVSTGNYELPGFRFVGSTQFYGEVTFPCPEGDGSLCAYVEFIAQLI